MAEDSSVERLQKKLYARGDGPELRPRRALHDEAHDVQSAWTDRAEIEEREAVENDPDKMLEALRSGHMPNSGIREPAILSDKRLSAGALKEVRKAELGKRFLHMILYASIAFFLISAGVAYYILFVKSRAPCELVGIDVSGPVTIPSGKELVLNIGIINNSPVAMRNTDLVIEYPQGTRSSQSVSVPLSTVREFVGDVEPGDRVRTSERSVLYAPEQSEQRITIRTEYRIDESNAFLTCETPYTVRIGTAPVSLTVEGLEEISSGQELTLKVNITSNSEETIPDQRLVVEYPFGFDFKRAEPAPAHGENVWEFGDIAPGTSRSIAITGVITAQGTEARTAKFQLGERARDSEDEIVTTLQVVNHPLLVTKPFLALELMLNGSLEDEVTVGIGEKVQGVLEWRNTLTDELNDVEIEARLPNALIDERSVGLSDGYFRSVDRTMMWGPHTNSALASVKPGATGRLQFEFKTKPFVSETAARDPFMDLEFVVKARRLNDNIPVQQTLVAQAPRRIKFRTDVAFVAGVMYRSGPFVNTGPYPPRANQETTYTIQWTLQNTTNELENVSVRAELPIYVTWLDKISPSSAPLTYNPTSRELIWNVGDVAAGAGAQATAPQVAFQLSFIPSVTQLDSEPRIVDKIKLRAVDRYTGAVIEQSPESQTTLLVGDPYFPEPFGRVVN